MAKPPPLKAQDKLAFLLSLVPYLLDHGRVSVAEAAEHFAVDEEAIRQAVRLIAVSGVPGDTHAYQHGDLFDISWDEFLDHDRIVIVQQVAIDDSPRFSAREAAALIAGLQYLSAVPENLDRERIGTLMGKLARGASATPSSVAVAGGDEDAALGLVRDAVASERQIEFDYLNARGDRERRRVDPLRIESSDVDWYVRGWCHLREAVRTFRIDRMRDLTLTDEPIAFRASDVALPDQLFQGSDDDLVITVDVAVSALPLLGDYLVDVEKAAAGAERVRASIRVAHFHGLKRLVAGLPGLITVLAPDDARRAVRDWARAGLDRYPAGHDSDTV
ncbi:helix-turn-helix transcriptional regulator [Agromyces sp. SYSU T00194]|uniref:helix-turn-helix transcriptional regulator n=1 Tax=Agromyces chitinivorans TaxID=3158560 RepID=UPI003399BCD4